MKTEQNTLSAMQSNDIRSYNKCIYMQSSKLGQCPLNQSSSDQLSLRTNCNINFKKFKRKTSRGTRSQHFFLMKEMEWIVVKQNLKYRSWC